MAWIIRDKEKMSLMLDHYVGQLQKRKGAMLLLPLIAVENDSDLEFVLRQQRKYRPSSVNEVDDRLGIISVSTKRTSVDALHDLSNPNMVDCGTRNAAVDSIARMGSANQMLLVTLPPPIGSIFVDLVKFAQKTGLPAPTMEDQQNEYVVYVRHSDFKPPVLILVQNDHHWPSDLQSVDSLEEFLPKLENRSQLDRIYTQTFPELTDGWQLIKHPQFNRMLTLLRPGYGYVFTHLPDGKGLSVLY